LLTAAASIRRFGKDERCIDRVAACCQNWGRFYEECCLSLVAAVEAAAAAAAVAAADTNPAANPNLRQFQDRGKLPSAVVMAIAEFRQGTTIKGQTKQAPWQQSRGAGMRQPQPTGNMAFFYKYNNHGGNSTPGRILHQSMLTQNQHQQIAAQWRQVATMTPMSIFLEQSTLELVMQ